jgi:hypothetical protein
VTQGSWNLGLFIQRRVGWVNALSLLLALAGLLAFVWAAQAPPTARPSLSKAPMAQPAPRALSPARWQVFVGRLPEATNLGQDLHLVFKLAGEHGVRLAKGEYQLQRDAQAQVTMFVASFPITESYGQTRGFIADVLNGLPHVSLDELAMERTAADQGEVGSRVRFTFMYREPR